jgi:hypothetical protein
MKLHFVGNTGSNESLEDLRSLPWDKGVVECCRHAWVWPLYCQLKSRGMQVSFSYDLEPEAINFIHGQVARLYFKSLDFSKYFIIGIRGDFKPFRYGPLEIVQNLNCLGARRFYMPHFPQPGLCKRNPARRVVENVCFAGQVNNSIDTRLLAKDLEKIGCRFVFKNEGEWQNLEDVDILLGVRSFSKYPYYSKPPTKLFNAWLANIPFVGGYDSAYEQVGRPSLDYLRVSTYDELLSEIKRLKNDPDLYKSLVEEGQKASKQYNEDRISNEWKEFIENKAVPLFYKWKRTNSYERLRSRFMTICYWFVEGFLRPCVSKIMRGRH